MSNLMNLVKFAPYISNTQTHIRGQIYAYVQKGNQTRKYLAIEKIKVMVGFALSIQKSKPSLVDVHLFRYIQVTRICQ